MKIIILLFLLFQLQCSTYRYKETPIPDFSGIQNLETKIQTPVFVIINHNGEVLKRGSRRLTSWKYIVLPTLSNHFQNIEIDLEKAELIIEIETSYISKSNPVLPIATFLTLSLTPYYAEIEFKENFRILKKTGEIVFQTNRFRKADYWFGIIFIFHGITQIIKDGNKDFPWEFKLIQRVTENIIQELKSKKNLY